MVEEHPQPNGNTTVSQMKDTITTGPQQPQPQQNPKESTASLNNGTSHNAVNGHELQRQEPPDIPHITINMKPYSEILDKVCQHAYKELLTLIKTLPSSNDPTRYYGNAFEEDLKRKKTLLELIVKIRNYFVKLYVLNKWSVNSIHFNKLIDLLNWLRGQQIFFDSLVENIKRIKIDLNFAKLPNHDLITSFIVLNDSHYHNNNSGSFNTTKNLSLLPTYNLLEARKLSAKFLLKALKNLNSLLHLKISKLFLRCPSSSVNSIIFQNCTVKDGKLTICINNEFEIVLTLTNVTSSTDTEQTAGTKKATDSELPYDSNITKNSIFKNHSLENHAFIVLDFRFKFGLDDLGNMVFNVDNELPQYNHNNLKNFLNSQILYQSPENSSKYLKNPLVDLYKYLHSYALNYKLHLLSNQLNMLINGVSPPATGNKASSGTILNGANKLTWGSNLKYAYNPEKSLITIFYWTQKRFVKHKSYIQIGVTEDDEGERNNLQENKRLSFKWFKDGKLFTDHGFNEIFELLENGSAIRSELNAVGTINGTINGTVGNEAENSRFSPDARKHVISNAQGEDNNVDAEFAVLQDNYQRFSIQTLLSLVLNKHVELIMKDVYRRLDHIIKGAKVSFEDNILDTYEEPGSLYENIPEPTRRKLNRGVAENAIMEEDEEEANIGKPNHVEKLNKHEDTVSSASSDGSSKGSNATSFIVLLDKYYLLIKLNSNKVIHYSIDHLTGYSFFINPSPSVNAICSKYQFHNFVIINSGGSHTINSATEREIRTGPIFLMPSNFAELEEPLVVAHQILIVRMELLRHETLKVFSVTGWVNCPIINIELLELSKLNTERSIAQQQVKRPLDNRITTSQHGELGKQSRSKGFVSVLGNYRNFWSLQYYQMKNWPSNWFLIAFITNLDNEKSHHKLFWLAQIKSINSKWTVTFHTRLRLRPDFKMMHSESKNFESIERGLDYDTSMMLGKLATNEISIHIVMEELDSNRVRTSIPDNPNKAKLEKLLRKIKFNKQKELESHRKENVGSSNPFTGPLVDTRDKLLIIVLDNRSLVPVNNIKNNMILTVELFNSKMKLDVYGQLKMPLPLLQEKDGIQSDKEDSFIEVDSSGWHFHILSRVDLYEQSFKEKKLIYFYESYQLLRKFANLITLTSTLLCAVQNESRSCLDLLDIYLDRIVLKYDVGAHYIFHITDSTRSSSRLLLELPPGNPHEMVTVHLQNLLNRQISETPSFLQGEESSASQRPINEQSATSPKQASQLQEKSLYVVIAQVIKYIHLTQPLVTALKKFENEHKRHYHHMSNESSLERVSIDIKYHVICHDLANYAFIYDIKKEATLRAEQNGNRVKHVISRSLIKISMSFKIARGKKYVILQMVPVIIENQLNGVDRFPRVQQYRALALGLRKLLAESVVLLASKGDIHFLGDCVSCEVGSFYSAINSLHEKIMRKFK